MTEYIGRYEVYKSVEADTREEAIEKIRKWAWSNLTGIDCEYNLEDVD